jgi:Spy/CpxP family protein refolding chaperone
VILTRSILLALALLWPVLTPAQHAPSPYAGLDVRPLKALSPQQVEELRQGSGMGLSLVAELNHTPGPRHALELAEPLGLTVPQRAAAQALFERMRAEAQALGERILARERDMERLFAGEAGDSASVTALAEQIGLLQGQLRAVHLRAHLQTRALLTPDQVAGYDRLRGYLERSPGGGTPAPAAGSAHAHHPSS